MEIGNWKFGLHAFADIQLVVLFHCKYSVNPWPTEYLPFHFIPNFQFPISINTYDNIFGLWQKLLLDKCGVVLLFEYWIGVSG